MAERDKKRKLPWNISVWGLEQLLWTSEECMFRGGWGGGSSVWVTVIIWKLSSNCIIIHLHFAPGSFLLSHSANNSRQLFQIMYKLRMWRMRISASEWVTLMWIWLFTTKNDLFKGMRNKAQFWGGRKEAHLEKQRSQISSPADLLLRLTRAPRFTLQQIDEKILTKCW